ncbi:hypothetical protein ANN_14125 [Periplaneta americana]|uniref:Uncharacterized protein n=1 Tax=Periplaneta americana TaxID=6978 RepID=A0ABQ8SWN4_PERAM|nr:hypothetical protein ANN_14125 [Periplaneta americana]
MSISCLIHFVVQTSPKALVFLNRLAQIQSMQEIVSGFYNCENARSNSKVVFTWRAEQKRVCGNNRYIIILLHCIVFERTLRLSVPTYKINYVYPRETCILNPHRTTELSDKVTIWCAISEHGLIGPCFIEDEHGNRLIVNQERRKIRSGAGDRTRALGSTYQALSPLSYAEFNPQHRIELSSFDVSLCGLTPS